MSYPLSFNYLIMYVMLVMPQGHSCSSNPEMQKTHSFYTRKILDIFLQNIKNRTNESSKGSGNVALLPDKINQFITALLEDEDVVRKSL